MLAELPPTLTREFAREIARLTRALREHGAVTGAAWGLCGATALGLGLAQLGRLTPLWYRGQLLGGVALLWLLAVSAGALLGYAWPRPLPGRLRRLERELRLAERLTTAWELAQGRITAPPALAQLQAQETLETTRRSDPRAAFPLRPPRSLVYATLALGLLLAVTLWLPNPQELLLTQHAAQRQAAETAAAQLAAIRETLADSPALSDAEREAALQSLDAAIAALRDRRSTPAEQQTALAEAEHALQALRSAEAEAQVRQLSEAAPFSTEAVVQPLSEALQRGDLAAAAEYLRALTDPTSGEPLTAEEMLALADAFAQLAENLRESDAELAEQFREIAHEIYTGDIASATAAVQQAAESLSEIAEAHEPNQALEAAQAGVQQTQDHLGQAQGQAPGQASAPGQPGAATGEQAGTGPGSPGHHEDTGSSAPYGSDEAARLAGQGGEITIPREIAQGDPRLTEGAQGEARIAYREVYAVYAATAEAQMAQTAYPPALRAYVREYFSGLGE